MQIFKCISGSLLQNPENNNYKQVKKVFIIIIHLLVTNYNVNVI